MGRLQAEEMRELLERDQALLWHLQRSHYPPVHPVFLDCVKEALENADCGNWDTVVGLPNGRELTTRDIVDQLHLHEFLTDCEG